MTIGMHNLTANKGARRNRKRVGRGNASGHGTYSTRGMKGQRARTGGKNRLKQKGMRALLLSLPKKRGFQSHYTKRVTIKLSLLEKHFISEEKVTPETLLAKGLLLSFEKSRGGVKILDGGDVTKKLFISGCNISAGAKEKILKAGGSVA